MIVYTLKTVSLLATGLLIGVAFAAGPSIASRQTPSGILSSTPLVLVVTRDDPILAKIDPKPRSKGPNKLLFFKSGDLSLIDPDGKNEKAVTDRQSSFPAGMGIINPVRVYLSPDGKRLAALLVPKIDTSAMPLVTNPKGKLYLKGLNEKDPWSDLEVNCETIVWAPDGNQLAVTDWAVANRKRVTSHHIIDVKTKEKKSLKLPDNHVITDWTADGKRLLTYSTTFPDDKPGFPTLRLHLMNLDGTEFKTLSDEKQKLGYGRIASDGTRVLCLRTKQDGNEKPVLPPRGGEVEMIVLDVATGKTSAVADLPQNALFLSYCWSPDGKQIAYAWRQIHPGDPKESLGRETESHLIVCDTDGKNQKTIVSLKAPTSTAVVLGGVDWR